MDDVRGEPKFESLTVQAQVHYFYKNWIESNPKQYSNACSIAKSLAKMYKQKAIEKELQELQEDATETGYPLGVIESIYYRDYSFGMSLSKQYNYEVDSITLKEIIYTLDKIKDRSMDLFTDICIRKDVKAPFFPLFMDSSFKRPGE